MIPWHPGSLSWNPTGADDPTPTDSGYQNAHPMDVLTGQSYPVEGSQDMPYVGLEGLTGALQAIYNGIMSIPASIASLLAAVQAFFAIPANPTADINMQPLQNLPLLTKFPFCIPFDLVAALTSLSDENNEAPSWTLTWMEEDVEIDFEMFDTLAMVVRYFVGLSFTLMLIMKTRDLVKG